MEATSPTAAAGDKCWPEALILNVCFFGRMTARVTKQKFIQSPDQLARRQMAFLSNDQLGDVCELARQANFASGLGELL